MKKLMKKGVAVLVGTMALAAVAGMAQAETRFAVQDSTGTTDKMVVTDQGFVGVGTGIPTNPLVIKGSTIATSSMHLGFEGNATYNRFNEPEIRIVRNNINDPAQNDGLAFNGDRLGAFFFGTIINSAFKQSAGVFVEAAEDHTTGSYAGNIYFSTTSHNSQFASQRMSILSTGNVGVGTTTPSQKLEVNGGVRLNTTASKPATCNATVRGTVWLTQGGTSTADTLDVCLKDANGNYAWATLN